MEIQFIIPDDYKSYTFTNNSELSKAKTPEKKEVSAVLSDSESDSDSDAKEIPKKAVPVLAEFKSGYNSEYGDSDDEKQIPFQPNLSAKTEIVEEYDNFKFWKLVEKMSTITDYSLSNIENIRKFIPAKGFNYVKTYIDDKAYDVEKICRKIGLFINSTIYKMKNFTYYIVFILGTHYMQCEQNIDFIKSVWENETFENVYDMLNFV